MNIIQVAYFDNNGVHVVECDKDVMLLISDAHEENKNADSMTAEEFAKFAAGIVPGDKDFNTLISIRDELVTGCIGHDIRAVEDDKRLIIGWNLMRTGGDDDDVEGVVNYFIGKKTESVDDTFYKKYVKMNLNDEENIHYRGFADIG